MAERKVSNKDLLILNKINDLYKNIPINVYVNDNDEEVEEFKNTIYFNDGIILFNGHDGMAPVIMGVIPKNNPKYEFLFQKSFKIECKSFFDYLKNGKDAATINYGDDFNFRIPSANNEYHCLMTDEDKKDIENLTKKIFEFKKLAKTKTYLEYNFDENLIEKFKSNGLYHLYFNKDTVSDTYNKDECLFQMDIYSKYLIKIDKDSKIKVKIYDCTDTIKYLDFMIETNEIKNHQYMKIVI